MYATLTAAALAFAAAQPPAAAQPDRPGSTPGLGQPGGANTPSVDGNWTIVVLEKNGQPVADAAKNMAVSIRGNMVTFNKTGTTEASPGMKAMRVEFGPNGTVRVSESDDNKFSATAPAVPPGTTPGTTGTGPQPGMRTGVYVLTRDYLAVCVHDTATGTGVTPGTPRTDTPRPGTTTGTDRDRPAAGTAPQPGGTSGVGDGRLPAQRSYVTVILRRTEGGRPAASE